MTPRLLHLTTTALAGLALGGSVLATAAAARPPIWTVRGPHGATVTLFGSVHLLSDRTVWAEPALDRALGGAKRLLFEVPLDAAAQSAAATQAMAQGLLPEGRTLSSMLSPDAAARLQRVALSVGADPNQLERLRPWLAEVTLSILYFQKRGATADLGVEKTIDARTAPAVARGALETVSDQIAALSGASEADQVKSLEETLREIEQEPDSFDKLAAAWARGDVKAIEAEGLDDLRRNAPGAFRRLVADRNAKWKPEIEALLKGRDDAVVVVGVGHLVGPEGVPALLKRDGYAVTGP